MIAPSVFLKNVDTSGVAMILSGGGGGRRAAWTSKFPTVYTHQI